jgi:hypothetical protein
VKILGLAGDKVIAEVDRYELQKVFDKYYNEKGFPELKVGLVMNLGEGYNFREDIRRACGQMNEAVKAFGAAQTTLMRFANMVSELPVQKEQP